jgi:hypothetical protein
MSINIRTVCLTIMTFAASATAQAAVVHREVDDGELSGNGLFPSVITLGIGSNEIFGRMGGGGGGVDRDYFVVTIPESFQLTAVTLLEETRLLGVGFIALQAGGQVTVNPNAGSASGLLGWHHYGADDIGTNMLPVMAQGFGAAGFTPPLGAGQYTFWLQETGSGSVTWGLDLQMQPVPLPGAWIGLASALCVLQARRRRAAAG